MTTTSFFRGPYDEAKRLVVEARDYMASGLLPDQDGLDNGARLMATRESMRVTTRLTQSMAWLLAERAVHEGEMPLARLASDEHALGGREVCADTEYEEHPDLPPRLSSLMRRSLSLYQRVERLDAMVRARVEGGEAIGARPVGSGHGLALLDRPALTRSLTNL